MEDRNNTVGLSAAEQAWEPIAPDIEFPVQLPWPAAASTEQRLMRAVLADGIQSFRQHAFAQTVHGRRLFNDEYEWIYEDGRHDQFSFENVCRVLNIDPDHVRSALRRWQRLAGE